MFLRHAFRIFNVVSANPSFIGFISFPEDLEMNVIVVGTVTNIFSGSNLLSSSGSQTLPSICLLISWFLSSSYWSISIIIDDQLLLFGSFNWTEAAVNRNLEDMVVTNSKSLIPAFIELFDRYWTCASVPDNRETCFNNTYWEYWHK
jgi:hypothetical protein